MKATDPALLSKFMDQEWARQSYGSRPQSVGGHVLGYMNMSQSMGMGMGMSMSQGGMGNNTFGMSQESFGGGSRPGSRMRSAGGIGGGSTFGAMGSLKSSGRTISGGANTFGMTDKLDAAVSTKGT